MTSNVHPSVMTYQLARLYSVHVPIMAHGPLVLLLEDEGWQCTAGTTVTLIYGTMYPDSDHS